MKVSSAVAKSVASMKVQDNIQQSIITARSRPHQSGMITGRARPPQQPETRGPQKAGRIKSKANTSIFSEYGNEINISFQDEQGNWVNLWFSLDNGVLTISVSSGEGGISAQLVNCSGITLSRNGINTPQDASQYFNQLTSQALQKCTF